MQDTGKEEVDTESAPGDAKKIELIKIKREEKYREEQEHISDFRDNVLEICEEYKDIITEIAGETEALRNIQSLISRKHSSLADCVRYIRDELKHIKTREKGFQPLKSDFKEEILRAIGLADSNYGANAKQNIRERMKERMATLPRDSGDGTPKSYPGPGPGSGYFPGVLADFRNHFKAHLSDYSLEGDDNELRDFYLRICDCSTDIPLVLTLYATFSYYLQYQSRNLSERENKRNQQKLISGEFVGALIGACVQTFLPHDSAFRDKYKRAEIAARRHGKLINKNIPLYLKVKALKECNEQLRERVGIDEKSEYGFCIPLMWEALKVSNETWKNERAGRREKILDVLWAYLSKNVGEYIRGVEELPSDLPPDVKALFASPTYFKEATALILQPDPSQPPPLVRSFEEDVRAGDASIIAAYFKKYSQRVKSGRKFPPVGDFISQVIKLSGIEPERKMRIVGELLYHMADFLLRVDFPQKKFVQSALIGCFVRAMHCFPEIIDKVQYSAITLVADDPDKSFTDTQRRAFLGGIRAFFEGYAIPRSGAALLPIEVVNQFKEVLHWDVGLDRRQKNLNVILGYIDMFFNAEPSRIPLKCSFFIDACVKCDIRGDIGQIRNFPGIDPKVLADVEAEIQKVRDARSSRTLSRTSSKKLARTSGSAAPAVPSTVVTTSAAVARRSFSSGNF